MIATHIFKVLCLTVTILNTAGAQSVSENSFLLKDAVRLSGIVTDKENRPLVGAWIHHTGLKTQVLTNEKGQFDIRTRAPAIVFRKNGHRSQYYRVAGNATFVIVLEPLPPSVNTCQALAKCLSLGGNLSEFCLPQVRGIRVSGKSSDIDYTQRSFEIKSSIGKRGILHASGPMWGSGLPLNWEVWSATEYSERDYRDLQGFLVLDARGKTITGEYWRVLGRAFETASYKNVSHNEAQLLDLVLDGFCIKRHP